MQPRAHGGRAHTLAFPLLWNLGEIEGREMPCVESRLPVYFRLNLANCIDHRRHYVTNATRIAIREDEAVADDRGDI